MNLRKILNIPNKAQKAIIVEDKKVILDKCQVIARREHNEQEENRKVHDGMCPKCNNRMGIVDKLCFVQGKGSVEGRIIFGFGKIKGNTSIDTIAVNYCMECGNEWLKYKTKPISDTSILYVGFKYLKEIIANPKQKKREWKLETIEVFFDCTAEALYQLNKWTATEIELSTLRRYFRSVFDAPEDIKLEKL